MYKVFHKETKFFTGAIYDDINVNIIDCHNLQNEGIFFTQDDIVKSFDIKSKLPNYRKLTTIEEESQRISSIINKADEIIYKVYPQKKQNKSFSIIAFLQDKQNLGQSLTPDEELKLQEMRDDNTWITKIRTIENTAIADKTLFEDIDWTAV